MDSLQTIKKRLKGINNIGQITKAMELVAATKMRKAQEIALCSRPYALTALELLGKISKQEKTDLPLLFQKRKIKKILFVLITSDKGLAGSFNSSVVRAFEKFIKERAINVKDQKYLFLAIGEKANIYLKGKGIEVIQKFIRAGDFTDLGQTDSIADFLTQDYLTEKWDRVLVFSTHFQSALKQKVVVRKFFPVGLQAIKKTIKEITPETGKFAEFIKKHQLSFIPEKIDEYLIEPSPKLVLKSLAERLVKMQFYHIVLEANASEHAARRLAMKNASDNAIDLSGELTILYNKSRQAGITKEIIEITAGAESLAA